MKKERKIRTILTITLYEDGGVEYTGIQQGCFTGQVEFIRAVNQLLAFCWRVVKAPAETIPGWKELCVGRAAIIPRKKWEQVLPGVAYVAEPE